MYENIFSIGERIQSLLDKYKLKQIDVCKITNISKNAMSNYISGNRIPETMALYKLSKTFLVSMEWLFAGEGDGPDNSAETIGLRIKKLRYEKNLSLQILSDEVGEKLETILMWENDTSKPSSSDLQKLCKYFNVYLEWLETGKGQKNIIAGLGSRIQDLLDNHNLQPKALEHAGIIKSDDIDFYITETKAPTIDELIKFSQFFNISVDWLLYGNQGDHEYISNQNLKSSSRQHLSGPNIYNNDVITDQTIVASYTVVDDKETEAMNLTEREKKLIQNIRQLTYREQEEIEYLIEFKLQQELKQKKEKSSHYSVVDEEATTIEKGLA